MNDLISRKEAIKALAKFVPYAICDESTESYMNGLTDAYNIICQLPSAEPKKGKWIAYKGMQIPEVHGLHYCSNCNHSLHLASNGKVYNYCPRCGAKMSEILTDSESEDKE